MRYFMFLLRAMALLLLTQSALAAPALTNIRHAPHKTYYRVVFDLTERLPVNVLKQLDQGYVDIVFQSEVQLLTKHFQQPTSGFVTSIVLHDVADNSLTYRISLSNVSGVKYSSQNGGSGFRFIVDCLYRSSTATAPPPATKTPAANITAPPPPEAAPVVSEETAPPEVYAHTDLLQLLAVVATLEESGNTLTACRILEEELVNYPDVDTLRYRLGVLYITAGLNELAVSQLDLLLIKPKYTATVAQLLTGIEGQYALTQTPSADSQVQDKTDSNLQQQGNITELSIKLLLAALAGLIIIGSIFLIQRKMAEHRRLAAYTVTADGEEAVTAEPEKQAPTGKAATVKDSPPAAAEEENPGYARDKEVYRLADKKKGTAEIAETLGLSQDEIRLILQLRHNDSKSVKADSKSVEADSKSVKADSKSVKADSKSVKADKKAEETGATE